MEEIKEVLQSKFTHRTELRTKLFLILGIADVNILPNPPKQDLTKLKKYISQKDAPILASALRHSDYLLTLDNEFFKENITRLAAKKNLVILKPKGFIEILDPKSSLG